MTDNSAIADYFQDQADHTQNPQRRAHYQRCADEYRAQTSELELSHTMRQLTDVAGALRSHGHHRKARERLLRARRIVAQQRQSIERKRQEGVDTTTSEAVLHTFQRLLTNFEHQVAGVIGDMKP